MSNEIVRAKSEVFLATNFWMQSEPARLITNAFRELSRRAVADGRTVVVKVMYDRGNAKQVGSTLARGERSPADNLQVIDNHQIVPAADYSDPNGPVRIPHPSELPGVELEVCNYHRPIFGTFHSKYMVVDRRVAIIQSNNIQDNDNLEMMTQFEGTIVESFYDTALLSWHKSLEPPLPCLTSQAAIHKTTTFEGNGLNGLVNGNASLAQSQQATSVPLEDVPSLPSAANGDTQTDLPQHTSTEPHYDQDYASEVIRSASVLNGRGGETRINAITRLLNTTIQPDTKGTHPDVSPEQDFTPFIPIAEHVPFPCALVNRAPWGAPNHECVWTPQNAAFTSALRYATKTVFIQTPNLNAAPLLPEILAACRRGVHVSYNYCLGYNDAGELLPFQGGHNEGVAHHLYKDLEPEFHPNLDVYAYVAKDQLHPIHNKFKQRSCHIKLMIADSHIGIQGNGNQDTQSWFHSQEVNIMIDSALVCEAWMKGIRQNQNTHLYGQVQKTGEHAGCWVDPESGKQAEGAIGVDAGKMSWLKGVTGAIARVRGAGGF